MKIKEQIDKAKDKNRLYSDLIFNLRLLLDNNENNQTNLFLKVMNPPKDITPEFKELSQAVNLIRLELITQLKELESFLPSFPIEGEIIQDA